MSGSLEDELGDVLEKSRDGKGWTQSDLAQASGMSVSDISRMERYEFVPDDSVLKKLAEVLDLHVPSLIAVAKGTWAPKAIEPDPGPFEIICLDLFVGTYPVKCYLLICKATKTSAVIDTGGNPEAIIKKAKELNIKPEKILLTHAHFDHAGGLELLDKTYNCPAWIDKKEPRPSGSRDLRLLKDGETISLGNLNIEVLFTPGHTSGGVSYKIHDSVFSGDAIFAGSMGRANSSWSELYNSITQRLLTLPDHTRLLPGHGPATTVGEEKRHNPFFSISRGNN
ncbi:MAG: MBL fold metallo-hydrolase [Nitrospina sp.]|jgi:hydroxyacylglutathione hydrolase|nr:MBL fold metallo-hydrolase [Nitrospina sp.]MBT3511318.1 MBL fold metallo-hydrolase [Nitrospina sp.]MBT3875109.1 MBL fold metallo-hydrolase [Nitrospina sp.]MBT4047458.1 MBL fold metallo-hydrolase [Nitrospina sp.]MBT4558185.1 MBL fold metallo-hydrolase [Nitrospina sp.]